MCHHPTTQTVAFLKSQVEIALKDRDDETATDQMRIVHPTGKVMNDDDSLGALENDSELHLVFAITDDEWEPVDIFDMDSSES